MLIQPPASSLFLDNFPLPTINKYRDIPNSTVPITTPAISLYSNFHTTIVIAVCPRLDSDILIAESSTAFSVSFTATPISFPRLAYSDTSLISPFIAFSVVIFSIWVLQATYHNLLEIWLFERMRLHS